MRNNKIALSLIFTVLSFCFLGLAEAGQEEEPIKLFKLYAKTSQEESDSEAKPVFGSAVLVRDEIDLNDISRSVLRAESWLRTTVLYHYPSTPITTVLFGPTIQCRLKDQNTLSTVATLLLTSMKNIHHSLTRWGLENDIKVSAWVSQSCFEDESSFIEPISEFLRSKNSTFTVEEETSSDYKRLGVFGLRSVNIITQRSKLSQMRRLSSIHLPTLPTASDPPQPQPQPQPGTQGGRPWYSVPSTIASPPEAHGYGVPPPCSPPLSESYPPTESPSGDHLSGVWCVAKPTVPADTLQEAMDYACGEGAAHCDQIGPTGDCYAPDTVVAHASYAFNSYWQRHKANGGTCSFGGTAMLVNNDPSYLNCRFVLS